MAVPRRIGIFGMFATVQENLAIAVDVAFEQEEHMRSGLQNAPRVRRLPRNTRRKALSLRIIFGHTLARELFGPGLDRKLLTLLQRVMNVVNERAIWAPDAGEVDFSVGRVRGRSDVFGALCGRRTLALRIGRGHPCDRREAGDERSDDGTSKVAAQWRLNSRQHPAS